MEELGIALCDNSSLCIISRSGGKRLNNVMVFVRLHGACLNSRHLE